MEKWSTCENIANKYSLFYSETLMVPTHSVRDRNKFTKTFESEIDSFTYRYVSFYDLLPKHCSEENIISIKNIYIYIYCKRKYNLL